LLYLTLLKQKNIIMKIIKSPEFIKERNKRGAPEKYYFSELSIGKSLEFELNQILLNRVKSSAHQFNKCNDGIRLQVNIDRENNKFYVTKFQK